MAQTTLTALLFISGLSGWFLFVVIITYFINLRRKELKMIEDIKEDLEYVKSEIKKIK